MSLKTEWGTSTYSHGNGGQCVEARRTSAGAAIRDTQNRELALLETPSAEWSALLRVVKSESA
ncbi:hypothetical protein SUDANB121_01374 [Nocardiopsis dassonvillei]|uniref:DUF397 domain-containing protein n=1 Tax=Nocardiopsis dassonvillei TaxID=2014 RepID=UPI003F5591A4